MKFDKQFETKLWNKIAEIEQQSQIEIVVIVKQRSANYSDIPFAFAAVVVFLVFTYFMFAPTFFDDNFIYVGTILTFAIAYIGCMFFPSLTRLFITKKRMLRMVEIYARAIFQKAGIHHTQQKIGTLIYCSIFEKQTIVIADRGAETALPAEEWQQIKDSFANLFTSADPAQALLNDLEHYRPIFTQYLPPIENDINELPDSITIDL